MAGKVGLICLALSVLLSLVMADKCPDVKMLPSIPGTCTVSHHCRKVTCIGKDSDTKQMLTIIFQLNRCHNPLRAKVSLIQPQFNLNWTHSFVDGEKTLLPVSPSSFTGGITVTNATMFLKVALKKTAESKVNFTLKLVGDIESMGSDTPVDLTLLEGQLPLTTEDCGIQLSHSPHEEHGGDYSNNDDDGDYFDTKECKRVNLPLDLRATCTISEHCSKLTCTSPDGVPKQDLTFKINRCQNPLTATILMASQGQEWSHTFKDGEEAKLPTPPPGYPSQPGEPQMTMYLHVKLGKLRDRVKFEVEMSGNGSSDGQATAAFLTTLMRGSLPLSDVPCSDDGSAHQKVDRKCPAVSLPSYLPGTCDVSSHCSKITCTVTDDEHSSKKMTITVKIDKCHEKFTADVTLKEKSSDLDFSHTFKDGEKKKLPASSKDITGMGATDVDLYLEVGLKKVGSDISLKVDIVGTIESSSGTDPVAVTLLQGKLPVANLECGDDGSAHQKVDRKCPAVSLPSYLPGTCDVSSHCSKITCTVTDDEHSSKKMTITVKIDKCHEKFTADVTLKEKSSDLDFSHTFKDGEKKKLPASSKDITGMGATDVDLYLEVGLKKVGSDISLKVDIVGTIESSSGTDPVAVTLLQGKLPVANLECDGGAWFTRQPTYVKALVIGLPLLAVIFMVLGVYCCSGGRNGTRRFKVYLTRSGSHRSVAMTKLVNEI